MIIDRTLLGLKSNYSFSICDVFFCFVVVVFSRRRVIFFFFFSIASSGHSPTLLAFVSHILGLDIVVCILAPPPVIPGGVHLSFGVPHVMLDLVGYVLVYLPENNKRPVYNLSFPRPRPQPYPTRMSVCCGGKSEN